MRKTFILLLVAALGVWGWVVAQFLSGYFGGGKGRIEEVRHKELPASLLASGMRPALDTAFRDPFQSYLYAQKPPPPPPPPGTAPKRPVLQVIEPPTAVLGGILWGDAPVAILKQDGATELVKEGGEAFGLKVQRIERHQVTVIKQGRKFTLGY